MYSPLAGDFGMPEKEYIEAIDVEEILRYRMRMTR